MYFKLLVRLVSGSSLCPIFGLEHQNVPRTSCESLSSIFKCQIVWVLGSSTPLLLSSLVYGCVGGVMLSIPVAIKTGPCVEVCFMDQPASGLWVSVLHGSCHRALPDLCTVLWELKM